MTTRALVVGLGSIGRRHAANLRTLLGPDLVLSAVTSGAGATLAPGRYAVALADCDGGVFADLDDALTASPDLVVVANPTSLHRPVVEAAVRAGAAVLVEKPVSDTTEGLDELLALVRERRAVVAVGCQMRFHPALVELAALLAADRIGPLVAVVATEADSIACYHPEEDYRQSYAARSELGGGVVLTQIHELDYLLWLFGAPRSLFALGGRLGGLEVDVEDTASALLAFTRGGSVLPVHLHLDFRSAPPERSCVVRGERGTVTVDLLGPGLRWRGADGREVRSVDYPGFARNDLYLDEMRAVLAAARGEAAVPVDLAHGVDTLRVARRLLDAITTGRALEVT